MKKLTEMLINDYKFVVTGLFLKACKMLNVSLMEMYLLLYFENNPNSSFDPKKLGSALSLDDAEVLESFNSLLTKGIITINTSSDTGGKITETIHLTGIKQIIEDFAMSEKETHEKTNLYEQFETELGRTISPMEYEIIESWLNNGVSEELILGALKEAVWNGVKNFRYIDKIIYEWSKKGFKSMNDVKSHLTARDNNKPAQELFDYNWLEDKNE